jgi:hypothetical protein
MDSQVAARQVSASFSMEVAQRGVISKRAGSGHLLAVPPATVFGFAERESGPLCIERRLLKL